MSESNGFATRDDLLGAPLVRTYTTVEIDGKKFRLRSLTAGEANAATAKHLACEDEETRAKALASLPVRYIVQTVVDGEGHRVFSNTDVEKLLDLDAAFIAKLAEACQKHSGTQSATVEAAEKNSETTPS